MTFYANNKQDNMPPLDEEATNLGAWLIPISMLATSLYILYLAVTK